MLYFARQKILLGVLQISVLILTAYLLICVHVDTKLYEKGMTFLQFQTSDTTHYDKLLLSNISFVNRVRKVDKKRVNKTLLFWSPQGWVNDWIDKKWETSKLFYNCRVPDCIVTKQRKFVDEADVVIFRASDIKSCRQKTKPKQIWIMFEHEAPTSFGRNIKKSNKTCHRSMFNWTMSYRRDSDFTFVHGGFSKRSSPYNNRSLENIIKSKKKTAVAFISHCRTQSRRLEYIRKLRKYGIDIDVYGLCGNLRCRSGKGVFGYFKAVWNMTQSKTDKDCFKVLDSMYKFYLSFENALCHDYATEKSLHLVFRHDIVPIIRDASNHTLFHPPNSYLDTKHFKNIESLADRIKNISSDVKEYKKFYDWKIYYSPKTVNEVLQSNLCDICERAHNEHKYHRLYRNIEDFLMSLKNKTDICYKPTDV